MKSIFTLLLISVTTLSFGQYVYQSDVEAIAKSEMHAAQARSQNNNQRGTLKSDSVDVHYNVANWRIVPGVHEISGSLEAHVTVKAYDITHLYFDLSDSLTVDSVTMAAVSLPFNHTGDVLDIDLMTAFSPNANVIVTIYYHGIPVVGNGFYIGTHSGVPVTWTLSEPYGASSWWPCKDGLTDKVDSIDINISTILGNRAGSQGLLQSVDTVGTDVVYHWKHRHPVTPYLVSIAVSNYEEFTVSVNSGSQTFDVLNYAYPENRILAESNVSRIPEMFQTFDSLFIPYPFRNEKYGHAECGFGGGMEHQTMTSMGGWNYDLIAHELAHQWFGDYVTCGSWEELWLNESFATYLTGLATEHNKPQEWLTWKTGKVSHITSQPDGSVFVSDTTVFWRLFSSRLTYDKGSMVIHMLRWKMGDDDFFQAMKNYLNDPIIKDGFGTTEILQGHLEAVSNLDLDGFFADWYYGEGFPVYTITMAGIRPNYSVRISQTTTHNSVDFFELPVPIQFLGNGLDTTMVFDNTVNGEWFDFTIDKPIALIRLDPAKQLITDSPNYILGTDEIETSKVEPVLYPQPAKDVIHITNIQMDSKLSECELFDVAGNKVDAKFTNSGSEWNLNIEDYPSGIYLISHPTWIKPLRFVK